MDNKELDLAEMLHNSGLNAHSAPTSKGAFEWHEYRLTIAKELLKRNLCFKPPKQADSGGNNPEPVHHWRCLKCRSIKTSELLAIICCA